MNDNIEKTIERVQRLCLDADIETQDGVRHFHHGHEYVNICGMKWATMNVGAKSPNDSGLYFAWGETEGHTLEEIENEKHHFNLSSYKLSKKNTLGYTKYGRYDNKVKLDLEDDAVHVNWGGRWRMPTMEDFRYLGRVADVCFRSYDKNMHIGLVCSEPNNSCIELFFPSKGYCYDDINEFKALGYYWSSTVSQSSGKKCSYALKFYSYDVTSFSYELPRFFGMQVRGIVD